MAFLGIDQSLNGTGVCRLSSSGKPEATMTVTHKGLRDGERLFFIKQGISSLLLGVEFAALEGYSFDSVNRSFSLGEVGGVIKVLLIEQKIPYVVVAPVLVKKFATGIAHADKSKMADAAKALGFSFADDNQTDAFFLARTAMAHFTGVCNYRHEKEVLETLKKPKTAKKRRRVRSLIKSAI